MLSHQILKIKSAALVISFQLPVAPDGVQWLAMSAPNNL